jgi:type III secretion system FlhB-like substrate exporter
MSLHEILKGVQLLDEKPEDLWNVLVEIFGH